MRMNLTAEALPGLLATPPDKGRDELTDSGPGGVAGLYVERRVTSLGQGTFYYRWKANGKTCHQRLGTTRDMTLAEARAAAKRLKAELVLGKDPKAAINAAKAVPTFTAFFEGPFRDCKLGHKKSFGRDEQLFHLRIQRRFGDKKLNEVTRQQIIAFHNAIRSEGLSAASANHHLRLLRHMYYTAMSLGIVDNNPVARIPMFLEDNKIERYLEGEELERLLTVLQTDRNRTVCSVCMFLLATGCRLGEALSARWSDIDMDRRVFVVRVSNSKSKKRRSVPLNDAALDVLQSMRARGEYEYVFANRKTGQPFTRFGHAWERIRRKAGMPDLRLHDLRHSYASFLVNSGRSLYEVQQILGHSSPIVTQRYAHLSTKALQDAAAAASDRLKAGPTGRVG